MLFALGLIFFGIVSQASGHGRLMDPVARASAWRLGFPTPRSVNDNSLYCGGFAMKQANGGKCGVCGDPWNGIRYNEAGGKYATGVIVKTYKMGQVITTKVDITANHFGWMEYRICPNNNIHKPVTHECLNQHVLQRADGKGTKVMLDSRRTGIWSMDYVLPAGMTCTQCVIQWKYHAGNSWRVDPATGRGCVGCGPQEEFYGCADVAIVRDNTMPLVTDAPTTPTTRAPVHTTEKRTTQQPIIETQTPKVLIGGCIAINNWRGIPQMDKWCTENCLVGNCPASACDCSGGVNTPTTPTTTMKPTTTSTTTTTTTSTTTTPQPTPKPTTQPQGIIGGKADGCIAINNWLGDPQMDKWCTDNCRIGNCPAYACDCSGGVNQTTTPTTPTTTTRKTTTSTTMAPKQPHGTTADPLVQVVDRIECRGAKLWAGNEYLNRWCADACAHGNCPPDECECVKVQSLLTRTTTTTQIPEPQTTTEKPVVVHTTKVCQAISVWKGIGVYDIWCTNECNKNNCPPETCACTETPLLPAVSQTTKRPTTMSTTTTRKPDMTSYNTCVSNSLMGDDDYWNGWCQNHCDGGFCPVNFCNC